jgi:hypothetical protein
MGETFLVWAWKAAVGGLVMTSGGWLIAHYRQSQWQRELRGGVIATIFVSLILSSLATMQSLDPGVMSPEPDRQRVFIDITPDYLIQIYKTHTDIQASRQIQPYIRQMDEDAVCH